MTGAAVSGIGYIASPPSIDLEAATEFLLGIPRAPSEEVYACESRTATIESGSEHRIFARRPWRTTVRRSVGYRHLANARRVVDNPATYERRGTNRPI